MPRITVEEAGGKNVAALLDTIKHAEIGPALIKLSDDGYNVLVGSTPTKPLLFTSYATHPRIYNARLKSTAAGAYQLLSRYYPYYTNLLHLRDFSPESQDRIALQMIKEQGAYQFIQDGFFGTALSLISNIWASMPFATYGQPTKGIDELHQVYVQAGGSIA
jgi:muramidase (phage lysozyme)